MVASDGNLLEQQLHALKAELAALKASVNNSQQEAGASAAASSRLMRVSHQRDEAGQGAALGDDEGWQAEPASDRDSVVAGTDIPAAGWIRAQAEQAPADDGYTNTRGTISPRDLGHDLIQPRRGSPPRRDTVRGAKLQRRKGRAEKGGVPHSRARKGRGGGKPGGRGESVSTHKQRPP